MAEPPAPLIGGIDAGGTTFKCAVAAPDGRLLATLRVPVTTPEATIGACIDFFRWEMKERGTKLSVLGIASFGPIDVDPASPEYGTLYATPKPGWAGTRLSARFFSALGVPVVLDTDVNGALAAEVDRGAAKGFASAAYITVGTGIGAAVWSAGEFLGKPSHPEFGHIRVERHPWRSRLAGICSFHGACPKASPARRSPQGLARRKSASDPAWEIEAFYLAQACAALFYTARPQRILLGGACSWPKALCRVPPLAAS